MVYPTPAQFCSCSCSASSVRSTNGLGHFYVQLRTFLRLLHPSSTCTLPSLLHSLRSCTSSGRALPPVPLPLVPLPPVLDITPDLTLVKSTSNPYLSCSDLVPFTLHLLRRPCKTSSPFPLPLRFIFLYLGLFSCLFPLHPLSLLRCLLVTIYTHLSSHYYINYQTPA